MNLVRLLKIIAKQDQCEWKQLGALMWGSDRLDETVGNQDKKI